MTLDTTTSKVIFSGNGATTVFSYSFIIPDAGSVVAIYTDTDGVSTTLAPSQYTITGLDDSAGGTITYPTSGPPIANGTTLTLMRSVPLVQETELSNQGGYYPDVVEAALDYLTMQSQQLQEQITRTITASPTDPDGLTYSLPSVDERAGNFLYFDTDGSVAVAAGTVEGGVTVSTAMQPVVEAATLAAARTAMAVVPLAGGVTVTGDMVFSEDVDVGGTFTVGGQELTNSFPFSIGRQFASVANGTYLLGIMPYAFQASSVRYNVGTGGGSFTAAVKIATTAIGGASAIAVSSSTTASASCTSANTGSANAEIYVTISGTTGSPTYAFIALMGVRT